MPNPRVHRPTARFAKSCPAFIDGLSFGKIITIAICGFILLAIGLTLTAVGSSPTKYVDGPLGGKVPLNSGNLPMMICGIILIFFGALVFFVGIAVAVRSARSQKRPNEGILRFSRGRTRASIPTRNVIMLPPFAEVHSNPPSQSNPAGLYYIAGLDEGPETKETKAPESHNYAYNMQPCYNPAYVENEI